MPRRDGTGPWAAGAMTGRGAGGCADPAMAAGMPMGGRGRGHRHMYYATGRPDWARAGYVTPPVGAAEHELENLKAQAEWLHGQLDAVRQRITEIEG